MISTHVYSAVVMGDPDVELSLKGGSITLDRDSAPHVTGRLTIATPSEDVQELLDPRNSPRLRLDVSAVFPSGVQARSFDVGIRDLDADRAPGELVLSVASDEALLEDYAPLADDLTPYTYQSSLRAIVNYALGQAIALRRNVAHNPFPAADGNADDDWQTRWGWSRSFSGDAVFFTSQGGAQVSGGRGFDIRGNYDVAPGTSGRWTSIPIASGEDLYLGVQAGTSRPEIRVRASVRLHDGAGNWLGGPVVGPWVSLAAGWARAGVPYTAPATGYLVGRVEFEPGFTLNDGDVLGAQRMVIEPGTLTFDGYFDGGTNPAGGTRYEGPVNASPSRLSPVLAATPDVDVSMVTPSDSLNMFPDPSAEGDGSTFAATACSIDKVDTSWAAHGTRSINLYSGTALDSFVSIGGDTGALQLGMRPGRTYVLSATGRVKQAVSGSAHARARKVTLFYRSGTGAYQVAESPALPTTVGAATRVSVTVTLPPDTTEAFVRAYLGYTTGQIQWDAFRLSERPIDPTDNATIYFDGSSADTTTYDYSWAGDANKSVSRRTSKIDRPADSLLWKAGVNALAFAGNLVQANGLRLVCDEERTWTLRGQDYKAAGALSVRYGVNLIEGSDSIRRDSQMWFDAQVTRYLWTDAYGIAQERVDAFALRTPYTKLNTVTVNAPYPGPGRSESAVRRAQSRGREVTVTTVANWATNAEQASTFVLGDAPTQTGQCNRVEFDLDSDRMTVTASTSDTPEGAIDLLPGYINNLVGYIDGL